MKKFLSILIVLAALVTFVLLMLAWRADSIARHFKPDLERVASSTLGSDVLIGDLHISFFPSLSLGVDAFSIGGADVKQSLRLKGLALAISTAPLLRGNLEISKILVNSPSITFIKDKDGINIEGLPKKAAAKPSTPPAATQGAPASTPATLPNGLSVNLQELALNDAFIAFKDVESGKAYQVQSLSAATSLNLVENVAHMPLLKASGNVMNVLPFQFETRNARYGLTGAVAQFEKATLSALGGEVSLSGEADLGNNQGHVDCSSTGLVLAGLDKLSPLVPALTGLDFAGKFAPQFRASWSKDGSFNFQGNFNLTSAGVHKGEFGLTLNDASIALNSFGGQFGQQMMGSLRGSADVRIKDGSLDGLNIAGELINAVKGLPFMSGSLQSSVPPEDQAAFNKPNTAISSLTAHFDVATQRANTTDFKLVSTLFTLSAQGALGFDGSVDLDASLAFEPKLSAALVGRVKELKALLNTEGKMVWPLRIQGNAPKILVLPDLNKVIEIAGKGALQEKAGKLLDNLLGGKKSGSSDSAGQKKGLGGLFGFGK